MDIVRSPHATEPAHVLGLHALLSLSPFPCSCSSSASWRSTECLAKNTGCPPVPSNPVVDFILISSFIIPTLDDIISQDYTIRNICMYFAQDIYYIRSCCKFCQPTRRAGSILKGVNMDVFAGCASEVHGSYQHMSMNSLHNNFSSG